MSDAPTPTPPAVSDRAPSSLVRWACHAACFALGVAAFAGTFHHPFVYDDHEAVEENWIVTNPDAWYRFLITSYWPPPNPRFRHAPGYDVLYRPLTIGSFRLGYLLHGADPRGHHVVNVLLHGVVSALVCAVAIAVWRRPAAGLVAGLLFAAHPVHADAVAPIVGRSELLAALFGLWLILRHVRPADVHGGTLVRRHVFSAILFAAAVLSKEHALFVWPVILLIDAWHRRRQPTADRRPWRDWFDDLARRHHVGLAYVAASVFFMRFWLFGWNYRRPTASLPAWADPIGRADLLGQILTPFRLLWLSARLCVDPTALCPLWNANALRAAERITEPDVLAGIALAAAAILTIVLGVRRGWTIAPWLASVLVLLAVPLHVIPVTAWLFAERWLYLPTAVLAVAVAGLAARFGRPIAWGALCLAIVLLPQTWPYADAWSSDEQLNHTVLRDHPDNFHAASNLAVVLLREKRYSELQVVASEMAERFPRAHEPYHFLVEAYTGMNDPARAAEAKAAHDERWIEMMQSLPR